MRVIGVDSEWDTADRTRLACVTICELGPDGRPLPAEILHGRDPALPGRLLTLFSDPQVITVFAWGCADAITFAGAFPGDVGLRVLQAMADATRDGRLTSVSLTCTSASSLVTLTTHLAVDAEVSQVRLAFSSSAVQPRPRQYNSVFATISA